jgi:hypothetical protein
VYGIKVGDIAFGFEMWFEWRGDFFSEECLPVYSGEERMSFELSCILPGTETMFRIAIEKLLLVRISVGDIPP